MNTDQQRAAFEAWYTPPFGTTLAKDANGEYSFMTAYVCWKAWKARGEYEAAQHTDKPDEGVSPLTPHGKQKLAEEIARYFAGYSFSRHEVAQCLGLVDVLEAGGYLRATKDNKQAQPKYKCRDCRDTGRISWTDYSNGQGLDIERTEDCDECR